MQQQLAPATSTYAPIGTAAATVIGLTIAVLVWAAIANRAFPVIGSDERVTLWVVFGLGFTMCAIAGVSQTPSSLGWLHPISLIGMVLGVLAIVPVLLVLFGWTAPLTSAGQFVGGSIATLSAERIAIIGLGLLILVKWALGFGHYLLR